MTIQHEPAPDEVRPASPRDATRTGGNPTPAANWQADLDPPVSTLPRLGAGIRWSDVLAEIRADDETRPATENGRAA